MRQCYVIPGWGGSQLNMADPPHFNVWAATDTFALGRFGQLRLAPDGTSPGNPDGIPLQAGDALFGFYDPLRNTLAEGLGRDNYQVNIFPYDWRLSAFIVGRILAGVIRRSSTPQDPCSIVAHSWGGILARVAWANLLATGQANLIRRIVTLGTAHEGSYSPVMVFSLEDDSIRQINFLNASLNRLTRPGFLLPSFIRRWTIEDIGRLIMTWPSMYEQFPLLTPAAEVTDPYRPIVYYMVRWPDGRGVSQEWLDHARTVMGPFLRSAASRPPTWVMTCVAGLGLSTPDGLTNPHLLGDSVAIGIDQDGDKRVVRSSALMVDSERWTFYVSHTDLATDSAILERIVEMVLAERAPLDPPPPIVKVDNPMIPRFSVFPVPGYLSTLLDC